MIAVFADDCLLHDKLLIVTEVLRSRFAMKNAERKSGHIKKDSIASCGDELGEINRRVRESC